MSTKITQSEIKELAAQHSIPYANLRGVIDVEAAGNGFDPATGKILIQFEPHVFKRQSDKWRERASEKWATNKVDVQSKEWEAFNNAFRFDPEAAMKSTSIGMMQVMGYHYALLGFKSVGDMWDYAKKSEKNQIELGIRYIKKGNSTMYKALVTGDWAVFAHGYNGPAYKKFKYDTRIAAAVKKYK